jgi:hypothetical protein
MKTTMKYRLTTLSLFFVSSLLIASQTALGTTVNHPEDGYANIQAAVNAAGCGGTVNLAAGTYNERVLVGCGLRLLGAGVGKTIIDGTNLTDPNGTPVIGLGNHPFVVFPFTQDYELANLTVRAGTNTTPQGVATAWTSKVSIHDLEILGFRTGIGVDLSYDDTIHDVVIVGAGSAVGRCIFFRELDLFRSQLPGGHMNALDVHHNVLSDCQFGVELQNALGSVIQHNSIDRTRSGLRLFGVGQSDIQHNVIRNSSVSGINLQNSDGGSIHQNTLCSNAAAIRYGQSQPDQFGFAASRNNLIHHNTFGLNGAGIVVADTLLGPGNREFKNEISSDACK